MSGPFKTKGKSDKPGGGGRFAKLANKMYGEGMSKEGAAAAAASAGRRKYGKKRFQEMAAAGRRRAAS